MVISYGSKIASRNALSNIIKFCLENGFSSFQMNRSNLADWAVVNRVKSTLGNYMKTVVRY